MKVSVKTSGICNKSCTHNNMRSRHLVLFSFMMNAVMMNCGAHLGLITWMGWISIFLGPI